MQTKSVATGAQSLTWWRPTSGHSERLVINVTIPIQMENTTTVTAVANVMSMSSTTCLKIHSDLVLWIQSTQISLSPSSRTTTKKVAGLQVTRRQSLKAADRWCLSRQIVNIFRTCQVIWQIWCLSLVTGEANLIGYNMESAMVAAISQQLSQASTISKSSLQEIHRHLIHNQHLIQPQRQ